jgi:RNA polymerase sigma factor (sigma-70 family)
MRSDAAGTRARFPGDFAGTLAAARTNRPAAWTALYEWLAPGVAGYLRMLGAREVDDLTCEVLLAVFRRIDAFDGSETNFRSWVFTVAHSRLIDERRRRARQPQTVPFECVNEPPTGAEPTESAAIRALEVSNIEAVCAQLPADQRAVVLLRIIAELSVDQVADILGKSPGAVKQLQRRGFETARRLFARQGVTL